MSHASSSYQTGTCAATGRTLPVAELMPLAALSPKVAEMVRKRFPDLDDQAQVSMSVISNARLDYTRGVLEEQMGELSKLDEAVVKSLAGTRFSPNAHPARRKRTKR